MKHSVEDLNKLEEAKLNCEKYEAIHADKELKIEQYVKSLFHNLFEDTEICVNSRSYCYNDEINIHVSFSNETYFWSSDFFSFDLVIDKELNSSIDPRESSGGFQSNVDRLMALRCKSNIYEALFLFNDTLDVKKITKLVLDKNNSSTTMYHYQSELNKLEKNLQTKENIFYFSKVKKFFKQLPENRVEELCEFIFDKDKTHSEIRFVTIKPNKDFSTFHFEDNIITMENYNKLSLKHNDSRISKKAAIELMKNEFYINNEMANKLNDISEFFNKKCKRISGDIYSFEISINELFKCYDQIIKIDDF